MIVSHKRRTDTPVAVDLSALSLVEIAQVVKRDDATLADAAIEYETRQRLGLDPTLPRSKHPTSNR